MGQLNRGRTTPSRPKPGPSLLPGVKEFIRIYIKMRSDLVTIRGQILVPNSVNLTNKACVEKLLGARM